MRDLKPPGLARRLLELWLPDAYGEAILGDLQEGFRARAEGRRWLLPARMWYWSQVLHPDVIRLRRLARQGSGTGEGVGVLRGVFGMDLRQSFRVFRRSPGYAAAVTLSLAIGIGGATAIFMMVNSLLIRPLPGLAEQDRLISLQTSDYGGSFGVSSYMDFLDFHAASSTLTSLAAFKPRVADVSAGAVPEAVTAALVTPGYFHTLGAGAVVGRLFDPESDPAPGAQTEVILAYGLWQRLFAGDPSAVGRTLQINGRQFEIIGVTAPEFRGTTVVEIPELFVPMAMQPVLMPESGYLLENRGWGGISIVGRLSDGASIGAALEEIQTLGARLATAYPNTNSRRTYEVIPLRDSVLPGVPRDRLNLAGGLLLAVVGLLWVVVCLNVANLFLVRALRRRHELAVRLAIGAGRARVAAALVLEFMLLAVAAGALGVVLSRVIAGLVSATPGLAVLDVGLDTRTALFAGLLTVASGVLCALLPALSPSVSGRATDSISVGLQRATRRWPRRLLVVGQVGLSVVLLFGTGVFVRTFVNLTATGPGFDPEGILTAEFHPGLQGYGTEEISAFYRRLTETAGALPGVESVALASALPGVGGMGSDTWFFQGAEEPERPSSMAFSTVTTTFFGSLGVPILEGRALAPTDSPDQPPVLVVNEAAARLIEQRTGRTAIGAGLSFSGPEGPFIEVVGVVADTRAGRDLRPVPTLYGAHEQVLALGFGGSRMRLLLRTTGPAGALAGPLRRAAAEVDPDVAASNVRTLDDALAQVFGPDRLAVTVLGLTSALAVLLVAVGLYGLLSVMVAQRTRDFGIRVALGAGRSALTRIVVREALLLSSTGLVLGLAAGPALLRLASGFLVGVEPTDPVSVAAGGITMLAVALLSAWIPARRAMNSDPLEAMRLE
ncbi:MAG: ABC transporter permease [Gemmatimonadetes bacterium]|nr:ABC transporter permease [Gemmatimonadota bacterium]